MLSEIEGLRFYVIQIPGMILLRLLSELAHPDLPVFLALLNVGLPSFKLDCCVPFGMLFHRPL